MPFHVFLSQSLSLVTGGLAAWKLAKDVILVAVSLFTICMVWRQRRADRLFWWLLAVGAAYAVLHLVVWALNVHIYRDTALLGTIYNSRLPALSLLGYSAKLLNPDKFAIRSVVTLVLAVSTLVAALAVLQYFLPKDLLSHLGYSLSRGVRPSFFIDDNPAFPRVMATLRDPNSLGAFLLVPLALLAYYGTRWQRALPWQRMAWAGSAALHVGALYLTFSRSAWLAAVLTCGLVAGWQWRQQFRRWLRWYWWATAGLCVVAAVGAAVVLRHSAQFSGVITHTTAAQRGSIDSNEYHWLYVRRGLEGMVRRPLGHGPGTAGLVSIQNPQGGLLTENYYVQIGYEVGVLGLLLFIALNGLAYARLRRSVQTGLTVALLASFWGYVLMNMLLHTWSNEAVATEWWLLAGLMLASSPSALTTKRQAPPQRA